MHRSDKAVLRLTTGLGLAVFVAYGLALQAPFVVCIMAVVVLCKPGPPMRMVTALVVAAVFAGIIAAGVLMVPLLEHYAAAGLLTTAVVLFVLFYVGRLRANPLITILVMAFTVIPVAGVMEQALIAALSLTLAVGVLVGAVVSAASSALFPDPPPPASSAAVAAPPDREGARWVALRGMLIIMPVFMLALTNPSFYMAAIMKTVALGQQAGETDARHAGRELVGSTLMGALIALGVWLGLSLWPSLWMLMLWLMAAALWAGSRLFRARPTRYAALVLEQRADHFADPARPGDRGQCQRQERHQRRRDAREFVRHRGAVCLGDRMGARALARPAASGFGRRNHLEGVPMTFTNFLIGLPVMLLCLIVQVAVAFWCVRYYVRQATSANSGEGFLSGIRPLIVATLALMVGNLAQIIAVGRVVPVARGVQRNLRRDLPLGRELLVARLRGHRHAPRAQAARPARGGERRADAGHERSDADGDHAAHDHLAD